MEYQEFQLPKRYHEALMGWQERNFADLPLLQKHWAEHFPDDPVFRMTVKTVPLKETAIEVGTFKGQPKISRAADMKGNMLYSAMRIIRAQCSTELGSVQQHIGTLDRSISDHSKFSVMRIMAEEFRHAYQMFWVLSHDNSWSEAGVRNLADETMEELLAMTTGSHVLDAFNIPFHDPLDNMIFAFLIDRVGKYQLSMQQVFSYAPMAQSMLPMLHEESFHLQAGYELVRDMAVQAALGKGIWSLDDIQRRFNAWVPRGLEMFGSPEGGQANLVFGFKNRLNGESAESYYAETARLLSRINIAVMQARHPDMERSRVEQIVEHGEDSELLRLPHMSFFRTRGPDGLAYQPVDTEGRRISRDSYIAYLGQVLPAPLLNTDFFAKYVAAFQQAGSN